MRRTPAFLGALAVLTPLLLTNASAASATSATSANSLTVTTLGRDGTSVRTDVQASNTRTHVAYQLISGEITYLPKGSYDVITDIRNSRDLTDTLGGKVVTVSGATKATIDARQGRPVKASLSPAPTGGGYDQNLAVSVCVTASNSLFLARNVPGSVYVIPSSSSAFELAYSSDWNNGGGAGANGYLGVGVHTKGLPDGVSATFKQSSLATLTVAARSGPETGDASLQLIGDNDGDCAWSVENQVYDATLPYSFTAHVSPGIYSMREEGQDVSYGIGATYSAGKSYSLTVNRAVWGPSIELPYTWGSSHQLYFDADRMFADTTLHYGVDATLAYKLTKSGKTLLSKTIPGTNQSHGIQPVIKSAGWYTLSVSATRSTDPGTALPSTALSTASALSLHFYTNPATTDQIRGYVTRFSPAGLDAYNQAAPGSRTTVTLGMQRSKPRDPIHQLSDSVKKVQAWDSTDGGKTWHAVTVKHCGSTWTTVVTNPASGWVSLRSEVTDSHGDTSTTTVVNGYAVS
jgi:hypothetical protein